MIITDKKLLGYLDRDTIHNNGKEHKYYSHYKQRKLLVSSLNDEALYLTDGSKWNDKIDRDNFNNDKLNKKRYAFCFTYNTIENMATWIINARIDNQDRRDNYGYDQNGGLLMKLPKKLLETIINNIGEVELGNFKNGIFVEKTSLNIKSLKIYLADIYYVENNKIREHYTNETTVILGKKRYLINKKFYDETSFLSKADGWKYEKECRLIVEMNKNPIIEDCHFLKIKLSKEIIKEIKDKCLIEDPANGNEEYGKSDLQGTVSF